jgi:hypothetical protein
VQSLLSINRKSAGCLHFREVKLRGIFAILHDSPIRDFSLLDRTGGIHCGKCIGT